MTWSKSAKQSPPTPKPGIACCALSATVSAARRRFANRHRRDSRKGAKQERNDISALRSSFVPLRAFPLHAQKDAVLLQVADEKVGTARLNPVANSMNDMLPMRLLIIQ